MRIKPQLAVLLSVIIVVLGVLISWVLGFWQTESNKVPSKLEVPETQEGAVVYDPADIRGSYTLGEISGLFEIPQEDLAAAFGVDQQLASAFKVKELESIYTDEDSEVGTSSVRLFVAWYKGLPYELKEESFLPAKAVDLLREKATLSEEQQAYLSQHTYLGE